MTFFSFFIFFGTFNSWYLNSYNIFNLKMKIRNNNNYYYFKLTPYYSYTIIQCQISLSKVV